MKAKILLLTAVFLILVGINSNATSVLLNFVTDMFNQISIKPQENGSMQEFPIGSTSIDGRKVEDPANRFASQVNEISTKTATPNLIPKTPESIENGKYIFNTYCIVCHSDLKEINDEGFANTKINELGMVAPAIVPITHQFTDGYIHMKIKYGGAVMPSLGYAITEREGWDVVNYIRELEKLP